MGGGGEDELAVLDEDEGEDHSGGFGGFGGIERCLAGSRYLDFAVRRFIVYSFSEMRIWLDITYAPVRFSSPQCCLVVLMSRSRCRIPSRSAQSSKWS